MLDMVQTAGKATLTRLKKFFTFKPKAKEKVQIPTAQNRNIETKASGPRFENLSFFKDKKEDETEIEEDAQDAPEGLFSASSQPNVSTTQVHTQKRRVTLKAKPPRRIENWIMPKISLLEDPPASRVRIDEKEIKRKAELMVDKLRKK